MLQAARPPLASAAPRRPKALFLDAAGTFLIPSEPVTDVYLRYSRPHGVDLPAETVLARFRQAYNAPWAGRLRYVGAAQDFWRRVVFEALDTDNECIFQDVYQCDFYTLSLWLPHFCLVCLCTLAACFAALECCACSHISHTYTRSRCFMMHTGFVAGSMLILISCHVCGHWPCQC